ncbi:MAG: hypothetical protein J0L75_14595 [Spirochaetes bacterium]|nr:hypothetical protein [Spirochaetota bacterium]
MGKVLGQKVALRVIHNALVRDRLPSVLLFHGADGVGKFETAQNLAKALFCQETQNGYCDRCKPCLEVQRFRHPGVLILANDDRLHNIEFLSLLIRRGAGEQPNRLRYLLLGEIGNLLSRQRDRYLATLAAEKKSFPEGLVVKAAELEAAVDGLRQMETRLLNPEPLPDEAPFWSDFLEQARKVQNSLDRSVIARENLLALMERTQLDAGSRRLVILQNIQRLSASTVPSLLKTLEEPPPRTHFILITGPLNQIPPDVIDPLLSRSFPLRFNPLGPELGREILRHRFRVEAGRLDEMEALRRAPGLDPETLGILEKLPVEMGGERGYNLGALVKRLQGEGGGIESALVALGQSLRRAQGVPFERYQRLLAALQRAQAGAASPGITARNKWLRLLLDLETP